MDKLMIKKRGRQIVYVYRQIDRQTDRLMTD